MACSLCLCLCVFLCVSVLCSFLVVELTPKNLSGAKCEFVSAPFTRPRTLRRPYTHERGVAEDYLAQACGVGNQSLLCGSVVRPFTSLWGQAQVWVFEGEFSEVRPWYLGRGTSGG